MSMNFIQKKKEIIAYFMDQQVLLSTDILLVLDDASICDTILQMIADKKPVQDMENFLSSQNSSNSELSKNSPSSPNDAVFPSPVVKIIKDYNLVSKKRDVQDFTNYFCTRFKQLEYILRGRKELASVVSLARLKNKSDREQVAIICIINKKETTRNGNFIFTVEDLTGEFKVLVNKNNKELFDLAATLVPDEVVGFVGTTGDNILFSNSIIQPEIMLDKEFKKHPEEQYAVFLSDLHLGSKYFLRSSFEKFIAWIRGETGSEKQRLIAKKVRYIFIAGDLVDGVGIYPNQDKELELLDIKMQYDAVAEYLAQIPPSIPLIMCAGNHDAVRLSEPQPVFPKEYADKLYDLPNAYIVSNPSIINIASTPSFEGFDVLMYHGYSFDYYVANVDYIRQEGGYDRADLIMKFMLKRRHLAPTYASTLFIPEPSHDALVIEHVPDFFITGHIHKTAVSNYRNVTLVCGSCWQATTSFQEKVGHHPEPARVPVVNLKTRKVTILNFSGGSS